VTKVAAGFGLLPSAVRPIATEQRTFRKVRFVPIFDIHSVRIGYFWPSSGIAGRCGSRTNSTSPKGLTMI
jgi:hypothetical protein